MQASSHVVRQAASAIMSAFAAMVTLSCTATGLDALECRERSDCVAAFGIGANCHADGSCSVAKPTARCLRTFPEDLFASPLNYKDMIVIGNLMDRSLATHRARENAVRLAIKQVNSTASIGGREIAVVFCTIEEDAEFDELSRADAALASATYLIDDLGASAIIGPAASDDVLYVADQLSDREVLIMSPSATSPALASLDDETATDENPGNVWSTAPSDALQSSAIAADMRTPGAGRLNPVENVAVIFDSGVYGTTLANVFGTNFQALGGTLELFSFSTTVQLVDRVTEASLGAFDEVLFVSSQSSDVITFLDTAAALAGFDDKTIFLTDAAANADVLTDADPTRFPSIRGTRPATRSIDDLVYAGFLAAYFGEYGEDAAQFSFSAHAYDAGWLIAAGVAWATFSEEKIGSTEIARGLRKLSAGPALEIRATSWGQLLERFRQGESVNVSGASGELDFTPATEETSGLIETWVIENGAILGIDTIEPNMLAKRPAPPILTIPLPADTPGPLGDVAQLGER